MGAEELVHEMGSLEMGPRVVVGSPSSVVSCDGFASVIGTNRSIKTGLCVYRRVFRRGPRLASGYD